MTNSRTPDDKAEVSRSLHFVIENIQGIRCRPGIVVEDYPELRQPGLVDLAVFTDGANDGKYGTDDHLHSVEVDASTGRVNHILPTRLEVAVKPNHACRAVGSWHWPRECHSLQDPINPYVDSTNVKWHHSHGLGHAGDFCAACRREKEDANARRS